MTKLQKRPPRARSLWSFLVKRLVVFIVPTVVLLMGVHWTIERRLLIENFQESLQERAMMLATLVTRSNEGYELEFADEFMPQYSRTDRPYFFQVWVPDGSTLERSRSLGEGSLPRMLGTLEEPLPFSLELADGRSVRGIGIAFPPRQKTGVEDDVGHVVVALAADESLLNDHLREGFFEVFVTGAVTTGAILTMVLLALRTGGKLLKGVIDKVEAINPGSNQEEMTVVDSPVEMHPILNTLNRSLGFVSETVARERRFNADVAHELRTPIAELQTATEVALRWPGNGAEHEALVEAHEIALQMGGMVESLLQLARLESTEPHADESPFDLVQLARLQLDRGDGRMHIRGPQVMELTGPQALWEIVLANLVDNAVEYSPPGTPIDVLIGNDPRHPSLRVENVASDPDPSLPTRAKDRLWRGDQSRESGKHSGLGLSIVEAVCKRLGATFTIELRDDTFVATVGVTA